MNLFSGQEVNWRGDNGKADPEKTTITAVGTVGDELIFRLANGHRAYAHQLTNPAFDKLLDEVEEFWAESDYDFDPGRSRSGGLCHEKWFSETCRIAGLK